MTGLLFISLAHGDLNGKMRTVEIRTQYYLSAAVNRQVLLGARLLADPRLKIWDTVLREVKEPFAIQLVPYKGPSYSVDDITRSQIQENGGNSLSAEVCSILPGYRRRDVQILSPERHTCIHHRMNFVHSCAFMRMCYLALNAPVITTRLGHLVRPRVKGDPCSFCPSVPCCSFLSLS